MLIFESILKIWQIVILFSVSYLKFSSLLIFLVWVATHIEHISNLQSVKIFFITSKANDIF